jgi:2-haloacid dehalogenase
MTTLDFSQFSWLTFDCYGTLISWEPGILTVLRPMLAAHGRELADEGILELYAALEAREEGGEYRPYRQVLESVVQKLAARVGFAASAQEMRALPDSIRDWQPFPDTVTALRKLKTRYKLGIISNIDDELFAGTAPRLEVPFDAVITAQQARSYKPSLNNFHLALERIGEPPARVLHAAQSLYHDVSPAKELGMSAVWVNRRAGKGGSGATPRALAEPDLVVPDLTTLANIVNG